MATPTRRLAALLAGITDNDQATKVTTAGIDDDAVNAAKIAANAVGTSEVADNVLTATDLAANSVGSSELADNSVDASAIAANTIEVKPHIIPGVLQPAIGGKLLNGATHSGAYGTPQTQSGGDGHSYYYTDIRGSKPIKDPRIGAYFGSQRHKIKSIQLLEQETATHGKNVYTVDGREWIRAVGNELSQSNAARGSTVNSDVATAGSFIEVVGYFLDANLLNELHTADRNLTVQVNGSSAVAFNDFIISTNGPLGNRYVDEMSLINIDLPTKNSASLGINTLRINFVAGSYNRISGIELITQDLSGSGSPNRSNIKIPAQNVVSYGKKFAITETNHHYNPFATKGDGSASTIPDDTTGDSVTTGWAGSTSAYWESTLDTATSLGLSAWESGGDYYRPVNGGRVVKWVDSTGTIKTSVNMMPPEAHAIDSQTIASGVATGNNLPTGTHNWSSQYLPQFGNKTVGSNLWTAMADNSSYPFETRPSGGLNGAWNNTSGYGLAYVAVTLTVGKLYRIRFDASSVSGVASYIGTASNSAATNWKNKVLITAGTNLTGVFRADSQTLMIVMHTANGAAAFTLSNMTLYELEEPNQAEVAKTFHWREFGNGAANGMTGGSWADASMLHAADDIAYVMDDGLTSLAGDDVNGNSAGKVLQAEANSDTFYITFIGTGITMDCQQDTVGIFNFAQNLPYGTHVLKVLRDSTHKVHLDGVEIKSGTLYSPMEITFHQPKRPLIPEDAVVLADYMLMADFVPATVHGLDIISKGVRFLDASRDIFYDDSGTITLQHLADNSYGQLGGFRTISNGTAKSYKLPIFGSGGAFRYQSYTDRVNNATFKVDGSAYGSSHSEYVSGNRFDVTNTSAWDTSANDGTFDNRFNTNGINAEERVGIKDLIIGNRVFEVSDTTSGHYMSIGGMEINTPIHTSHHYQSFETPYLHELVGGDRNMEQTNLVCSPDGKTWDELTRDTSYIGSNLVAARVEGSTGGFLYQDTNVIWDEWRGRNDRLDCGNKDSWAIAYDRMICLKDGEYTIIGVILHSTADRSRLVLNGSDLVVLHETGANDTGTVVVTQPFKRGDVIYFFDGAYEQLYSHFQILKA